LTEEATDHLLWRNRLEFGYGPLVGQTTEGITCCEKVLRRMRLVYGPMRRKRQEENGIYF
jgi:hypothetical protein